MSRIAVFVVSATLVLGACGSSGGGSASKTTTTTKPPGTAVERKIARAGLLTGADISGSSRVTRSPSEANDLVTVANGIAACDFFTNGNVHERVNGGSYGFQRDTTVANSSVVVYASAADAVAELELYRDPAIIGCLDAVYRKVLAPTGTLGTLSVSPMAVEIVGDGQFGYLVTAEFATGPAASRTLLTGIAGVRVGRALSSVNITGPQPTVVEIETTALPKIADRLKAAQG